LDQILSLFRTQCHHLFVSHVSNFAQCHLTNLRDSTQSISPAASPPASQTTLPPGASIPTGFLSPLPYTDPPISIAGASLASSGSGSSGLSESAITGAVFGVLVGITLCIFAVLLYRRRRRRNRIAPSTAYMNYRSTTEQPPVYSFAPSRSSFLQSSKVGLARLGGRGNNLAGFGQGAAVGAGGRKLTTLDEKSAEEGGSTTSSSTVMPPHEYPQRAAVPSQSLGGGWVGSGSRGAATGAGGYGLGPAPPQGLSIDSTARTLTPPPSSASGRFVTTPASVDTNPYDGIAELSPAPNAFTDPFSTPPAETANLAGRGAWARP